MTLENVKKAVTENTKIISLAIVTNVLGYEVPIKEITEYAHSKGIIVVADGAQSVPHIVTDVVRDDVDLELSQVIRCVVLQVLVFFMVNTSY